MAAEIVDAMAVAALADAAAEALMYGDDGEADEQLSRLVDALARFTVPRRKQSRVAHYAYRAPAAVPLWLRSTAALCRLVQMGDEEQDELVSRLVALSWGLGDMDTRYDDVWRANDADLIRRYDSLSFGVMKALRDGDETPTETRERRKLTAWLAKLAGGAERSHG